MSKTIRYIKQPEPGDSGVGQVAYRHVPAKAINSEGAPHTNTACGILFCGGFNSNMDGGKASYLQDKCEENGLSFTRFDYRGHGESDCSFADGTIGDWLADARLVFNQICTGPHIIVGSSMGAWIAMLLAGEQPSRIDGLVLIAPAPDFTNKLMEQPGAREALERDGIWYRASEYSDDPYPITRRLIEEGAQHEILDGPLLRFTRPVHILHGDQDDVVPVAHAERVARHIDGSTVELEIIQGSDHRMSTDSDLARIWGVTYSIATNASR